MHTVKISALGPLKEKITQEQEVQLSSADQTAFELVDEKFGVITSYSIHYTKLYE